MTTFSWMLYLAFTLLWTIIDLIVIIHNISLLKQKLKTNDLILWIMPTLFTCILWSIWYFYYLH
jgi:hypothetical protein